jgi:Right handed beta helix region
VSIPSSFPIVLFALAVFALATPGTSPGASSGTTLWVTNDGVDSSHCGARSDPCRSISRGMDHASDGDTIEVGAGRYGDLNGDGQLGGPGEENGSTLGLPCDVCVSKSLTILSVHGAEKTLIVGTNFSVVSLSGHYVTFGAKDHGFTVVGGGNGLIADSSQFMDVKVGGNVAVANNRGFSIQNFGTAKISDNRAEGSGEIGFVVSALYQSNVTVERNVAVNCGLNGFLIWAHGVRLLNNVATRTVGGQGLGEFADAAGFFIQGSGHLVEGNSSIGNAGAGFTIKRTRFDGPAVSVLSFRHNTVTGNVGPGVALFPSATGTDFSDNNIYGNATGGNPVAGFAAINCGIFNAGGSPLQATKNFWGSATGPGPDPADAVGSTCDQQGSVTSFKPFATEFQ